MNTPRRYVILFRHVFSQRDYIRYGCDDMRRRGYEVVIVQCGKALEGLNLDTLSGAGHKSLAEALTPNDKDEMFAIVADLSQKDLIEMSLELSRETAWLFLELGRRKLNFIKGNYAPLPTEKNCGLIYRNNWWAGVQCYMWHCRHFIYRVKIRLKLIMDIGPSYFLIPSPLFWVAVGTWRQFLSPESVGLMSRPLVSVEGYEIFWVKMAESHSVAKVMEPYALFIDSALPHHPDFKIINASCDLDEKNYYEGLRCFFDRVENHLGLRVIVTLHPKSKYTPQQLADWLGGREVVIGETPALIKNCDLTLAHNSTATIIAALYRKPIWFLMSNELESTTIKPEIDARASWLNQPIVNLDGFRETPTAPLPAMFVEEKIYQNFVEKFAKAPGACEAPIWEKIAERFEDLTR